MIFDVTTFTLIHVVLSLVGIFAGLVVVGGLVAGKQLDGWTAVFLVTQLLVLVLFVWLGRAALKGFRGGPSAMAGRA